MALLEWNSSYSVGIQPMDRQHTVLFGLLNSLHFSMMKGQAQTLTGPLLKKLIDYTHTHFAEEEALMAKAGYPGLPDHRVKHRDLLKQVEDLAARHQRGEMAVNLQLLNFLRDWLSNHIPNVDHEYGPWLKEHGVH